MGSIHYLRDKKASVETLAGIRSQLNEIGQVTQRTADPILRATRVSPIMNSPSVKRLHQELDAGGTILAPVHLCYSRLLYVVQRELAKYVVFGDDLFGPFQRVKIEGRDDNVTIEVWQGDTPGHLMFTENSLLRLVFPPLNWRAH